jgi:sec-independent protein translocase protein TatC
MIKRQAKKTQKQKQTSLSRQPNNSSELQLTFLEHVYEVRSRLFWIVISLLITSGIGLYLKDYLVNFIVAPLHGEKLVYLTPGGGFTFIFTVCLYFGALLTIPVIMYHIYRFMQPVLGGSSRRMIVILLGLSCALAAGGATFGYFAAIPAAINFLMTFAGSAVESSLTAESYLGFVVAYMLGLAVLFQLPLLLFLIDHVKPFPPGALLSSQRFVIVGAVIAAALITPTPDIVNQLIVAAPIILIYQFGAIAVFIRRKVTKSHRFATKTTHSATATIGDRKKIPSQAATMPLPHVVASVVKQSDPVVAQKPAVRSIDGVVKRGPVRTTVTVPSRQFSTNRSIDGIRRSAASRSTRSTSSIIDTVSIA